MSNSYNDVMKGLGLEVEPEALVVENKGGRFEFGIGTYKVLIGDLHYKYTNAEDKTCKKEDIGAKLGYGQMDFIVIEADGKPQVNKSFEIDTDLPPGAFIQRSFIPFQADKQFQNKSLFEDFYINDQPSLSVIQPVDKTFRVNFSVLPVYRGCPTIMTIEEKVAKSGKKYNLASFKLTSHIIDKNTLVNRGKVVDKLYEQINELWEKTKATSGSTDAPSEVAPDAGDVNDIMSNFS